MLFLLRLANTNTKQPYEICNTGSRGGSMNAQTSTFTCAQYWDLATFTRSLRMGWDWDTRLETAWMTAVNLGCGLIPETQTKHLFLEKSSPTVSHQ